MTNMPPMIFDEQIRDAWKVPTEGSFLSSALLDGVVLSEQECDFRRAWHTRHEVFDPHYGGSVAWLEGPNGEVMIDEVKPSNA